MHAAYDRMQPACIRSVTAALWPRCVMAYQHYVKSLSLARWHHYDC